MSIKSLTFKTLPYQPDALLQQFTPLANQEWAMLLHSGFAEHAHNRFDILVADPVVTLTTRGEQTEIVSTHGTTLSHEDPFTLLQQELDKILPSVLTHPDLPFLGGHWDYLAMILAGGLKRSLRWLNKILPYPIWPSGCMTGRSLLITICKN